jgi:DnaJ-class molecular chaperone
MKKVTELNHYEILDLKPSATKAEIQQSFNKLRKTYEADSLAIYSIISEEEREYMMARIQEAFEILIDEEKRQVYDRSIGVYAFNTKKHAEASKYVGDQSERKSPGSSEEILNDAELLDPLSQDFLRNLREMKGVSLTEISDSTNIKIHFLSALENGEYGKLPGRAYAVGFLREYAKYLGIDFQVAKQNLDKWAKW